jgi:hypothetical protein
VARYGWIKLEKSSFGAKQAALGLQLQQWGHKKFNLWPVSKMAAWGIMLLLLAWLLLHHPQRLRVAACKRMEP